MAQEGEDAGGHTRQVLQTNHLPTAPPSSLLPPVRHQLVPSLHHWLGSCDPHPTTLTLHHHIPRPPLTFSPPPLLPPPLTTSLHADCCKTGGRKLSNSSNTFNASDHPLSPSEITTECTIVLHTICHWHYFFF